MCVDYMREIEVAEFCVLHIAAFHLFINSMFPCSLFAGVKRERPKVVLEAEFLFGRWQRINNQILAQGLESTSAQCTENGVLIHT